MKHRLVECVPNVSEGRNSSTVEAITRAIAAVPGVLVLRCTSDIDHNRSVITFAAPAESIVEAALRGTAKSVELIDLNTHSGVHPRLGALDVLPFVPLEGMSLEECTDLAHEAGHRIWSELGVPVYFYEAAALRAERRKLEDVRRGQFEGLRIASLATPEKAPDVGGPGLHPTAGAVIVGARKILIAYNINLNTVDLSIAQAIARQIRERDGGLAGLKALGVPLASRNLVQVSMNVTDHEATPLDVIYKLVEQLAAKEGVTIVESEVVGLVPRAALERAAAGFLKIGDFRRERVLENRIEEVIE